MLVFTKKEKIFLYEEELGSGGEGTIHNIRKPESLSGNVAKIYHEKKIKLVRDRKKREEKIAFMITYAPGKATDLIWPNDILYDKTDNFVGFLMPFVDGCHDVIDLCGHSIQKKRSAIWQRFDHTNPGSLKRRLILCSNIAYAVARIHATKNYVLVDLKPENIKIFTHTGTVALIDLDAIQIAQNNTVLFPSLASTPEFSPPEAKDLRIDKDFIPESWDNFSLAVIFYKLLIGVHPFSGTYKSPYDGCTSMVEGIEKGLFPHGSMAKYFAVVTPPHKSFSSLPKHIQTLFCDCFDQGCKDPSKRPTADDWFHATRDCAQTLDETSVIQRPKPLLLSRTALQPNVNQRRDVPAVLATYSMPKGMFLRTSFLPAPVSSLYSAVRLVLLMFAGYFLLPMMLNIDYFYEDVITFFQQRMGDEYGGAWVVATIAFILPVFLYTWLPSIFSLLYSAVRNKNKYRRLTKIAGTLFLLQIALMPISFFIFYKTTSGPTADLITVVLRNLDAVHPTTLGFFEFSFVGMMLFPFILLWLIVGLLIALSVFGALVVLVA